MNIPAKLAGLAAVAVLAGLGSGTAAAASDPAAGATTWRCTMPGGQVVYSDTRCAGAAEARRWHPATVAQGIRRGDGGQRKISASIGDGFEPLLPQERVDPFIDCRHRGGRYDLTGRVCHLPPGGVRTWTQVEN